MEGRTIEGDFPSIDDFQTRWKDIYITGSGVYNKQTNEVLMDDFQQGEQEGQTFPAGGVEKRDYIIYNDALKDNVTVSFSGETDVFGRTGYVYSTDINDVSVDAPSNTFSDVDMDNEIFQMMEGIDYLYSDASNYVLDPRTSIPYDIQLNIASSFIFPDSTMLTVMEEQTQYQEETIWIPSTSGINRMEEIQVIKETTTRGRLDDDDEEIALYQQTITFYDMDTGEPLPQDLQGGTESFAVDRNSYQYILGYKGTGRSGYFQFPIANVMKRDYPMWDESIKAENVAEFNGETQIEDKDVYIYQMVTEDIEVEGGNAFLPIYLHPGTTYELDTVQQWFIDSETGFMLDFRIDGTIRVSSSGPLGLIEQSVGSFSVDLPDNTTDELLSVSNLFRDLLIPMSGQKVDAFAMEISFTENLQQTLVEVADQVAFIMDLFESRIPMILTITGITLIVTGSIVVTIMIVLKKRRPPVEVKVYAELIE
jgi:hypothetical protein